MIDYTDDFTGKVAVVTGAASGIGKETATRISKNGAKVALWDYDEKNIELVSEKIGNNSIPLKVDVSDENSIKNAAEIVRNKLGTPSLLVNCAGVAGANATVANTDPNEWRRVININLTGTFLCCRELVSGMVNNNYGRIVNIASVAGKEGNPNAAHYSASKAGVITFTRSLAKEISSSGVLVNSITPAVIDTKMLAQVSNAHKEYMVSKIPMGRMGKTSEVAALICWLLSKECSYSTAATFDLSGGRATY
ncbi:MAG: 3-oxoacyl-[acyl-carrier-protein] reductase FabG [Alphaproteobacteria bacterium MarineAlpha9_Bin2]|nr:MAG: 3-oxoacyl-[acyl-carrier-protein] reductase FabG [Alphaproteobacteria bacterium MarineAlpha9_Bin1]PPR30879.1 MAG: 3-oxoacyl-[acyl-carrier-protein] reductase FabG [Alphaproteobacteria bacterium MarineAlpha9_Bin2]